MTPSDKLREIAAKWKLTQADLEIWRAERRIVQTPIPEFLSDLTALISENYVERAKYDEAVRQRDELREALIDMVWQFAYEGTKNGKGVMYTGGLSALEGAFSTLGLSDPITVYERS